MIEKMEEVKLMNFEKKMKIFQEDLKKNLM